MLILLPLTTVVSWGWTPADSYSPVQPPQHRLCSCPHLPDPPLFLSWSFPCCLLQSGYKESCSRVFGFNFPPILPIFMWCNCICLSHQRSPPWLMELSFKSWEWNMSPVLKLGQKGAPVLPVCWEVLVMLAMGPFACCAHSDRDHVWHCNTFTYCHHIYYFIVSGS